MMTLKEVVEIALNNGFSVPRYKVDRLEIDRTVITVYYHDNLLNDVGSCHFRL